MSTRRQFITVGAGAVVAAVAAPAVSAWTVAPSGATLTYATVAFDSRHEASLMFGAEARLLGAAVHDIDGNITGLYAEHLLDRWRTAPVPVAGMTTYNSMFVLRMMAEGAGLRLIYQARHVGVDSDRHVQFGPTAVLARAGRLSGPSSEWTREAARTVMTWPAAATGRRGDESTILQSDAVAATGDSLVSWILAPRAQGLGLAKI